MVHKDRGHILYLCVTECMVGENLNTPNLSPYIPVDALHGAVFADKVTRHNTPLPGLQLHTLPDLNHDRTDHNTKPMKHWCIARVA